MKIEYERKKIIIVTVNLIIKIEYFRNPCTYVKST